MRIVAVDHLYIRTDIVNSRVFNGAIASIGFYGSIHVMDFASTDQAAISKSNTVRLVLSDVIPRSGASRWRSGNLDIPGSYMRGICHVQADIHGGVVRASGIIN